MKAQLTVNACGYEIELTAENTAEAAALVHLGSNHIREIQGLCSIAHLSGEFTGHIYIGQRKDASTVVPRRK